MARTGSGASGRCAVGADRCRADERVRVAATGQHAAYDHRRLGAVPGHPAGPKYQESARRTGRPSFTRPLIAASTITNMAPRSSARLATAASTITIRIASRWRLAGLGCSGSPGPRRIGAAGTAIRPSRPAPPGSSARSLTGTRNRQSAGTYSPMLNSDWARQNLPTPADDAIIRTCPRTAIPPKEGVWPRACYRRNEIWVAQVGMVTRTILIGGGTPLTPTA